MKGIILAGGSATRLRPASLVVNKQLMPVYDKPLIYYPLTTLILMGIREILLISGPDDAITYKKLFKEFLSIGVKISFEVQAYPNGIAESILIGENFIQKDNVSLILGDNLIHGAGLGRHLKNMFIGDGALIHAYQVSNPVDFGNVQFDEDGRVISLIEKPKQPKSNWAVPGLYHFDETVVARAKQLENSDRGELEITDLNLSYMRDSKLLVKPFPRGTVWLDLGTPNSMLEAANYIRVLQERQGLIVGSPEEAAWRNKWITDSELLNLADKYKNSKYGESLRDLIQVNELH